MAFHPQGPFFLSSFCIPAQLPYSMGYWEHSPSVQMLLKRKCSWWFFDGHCPNQVTWASLESVWEETVQGYECRAMGNTKVWGRWLLYIKGWGKLRGSALWTETWRLWENQRLKVSGREKNTNKAAEIRKSLSFWAFDVRLLRLELCEQGQGVFGKQSQ